MFTVGIATYDDYSGLYFTIQSLRLHHPLVTEIVVIDNNPESEQGKLNKSLCISTKNLKIQYIKYTNKKNRATE